jgi:hypothetical protein
MVQSGFKNSKIQKSIIFLLLQLKRMALRSLQHVAMEGSSPEEKSAVKKDAVNDVRACRCCSPTRKDRDRLVHTLKCPRNQSHTRLCRTRVCVRAGVQC